MAPALLPDGLGAGAGVLTVLFMHDVVGHCEQDRLVSAQVSSGAQLQTGGVSGQGIQRRKRERSENSLRTRKGQYRLQKTAYELPRHTV
jgi:hypothetical protein